MSNKNLLFKTLCLILTFTFILNQVAFAADTFSYQYKYSASKSLLPDNTQKDQGYMTPAYIANAQAQHEAVINQKNLVETQANYLIQNQKPAQDQTIVLQKKQSSQSGTPKKQIAYALTDYDGNGKPQQMYVYTYGGSGGALSKVVSYDLRDLTVVPWLNSTLQKINKDGQPLMMGSFAPGDYTELTDSLKVKTVYYSGSIGNEKVDYILSDYVNGTPGSVLLYQYDASSALTEVDTYDITTMKIDFDTVSGDSWKTNVTNDASLTSKAIYEGASGSEKEVYALSEYDATGTAGRIDCYDYNSDDSISQTRAYNIKGVNLSDSITDLRANASTYDQYLTSKTNYKGAKNEEAVDSVLSSYYLDTTDNLYKPENRTSYIYDTDGHLDKTEGYFIKNGVNILQQASEFTGLKGYEVIALSYDYESDGTTINSVSVYNYTLAQNLTNPTIGGDGNNHTLDEVKKYVGTSDPHDLTSAKVESETFYSGPEGKELRTHTFNFDIEKGTITSRTDYKYNNSALTEIATYRLLDPDIGYDVTRGTLVSSTTYAGLKTQEKPSSGTTFDMIGNVLTTTSYQYNPNGSLGTVSTFNQDGKKVSVTIYSGPENQEKISTITNFDLSGNILTISYYTYGLADNLERTDTFNSDDIKTTETIYSGRAGNEKVSNIVSYDLTGSELTNTTYNYNVVGALVSTVTTDASGIALSEANYSGPAGYEKISSVIGLDKLQNVLTITSYLYDASGALVNTVITDSTGLILSESDYSGLSGAEKVSQVTSFDMLGNILTGTSYFYNTSGALEATVIIDSNGIIISESVYSGQEGAEKIANSIVFDKLHNVLTTTSYIYGISGALVNTVTKDPTGIILSESEYTGPSGQEKISSVTSFDKLHNILTVTNYSYDASGALTNTETLDASGVILSETYYSGLANDEKVTSVTSFDKLHNVLTITSYSYDASGAITSTVTKDASGVIVSESVYSGLANEEKVSAVTSFDKIGTILTVTIYSYDASGALTSTLTKDTSGITLSNSAYTGLSNQEKISSVTTFDKLGVTLTTTGYVYNASGAITSTLTKDSSGIILSKSTYSGVQGQEKVSSVTTLDKLGDLLTTTSYNYAASGALINTVTTDPNGIVLSETSYFGLEAGEKVSSVTNFDALHNILTVTNYSYEASGVLTSTVTTDASGVVLSESAYAGISGEEKVLSVSSFDKLHNLVTTTSYIYANSGALTLTRTVDSNGTTLSEYAYSGLSGREKIVSATSFDKSHNILTVTSYLYNASGALSNTVITDASGIILSESTYLGQENQEKVLSATSFDKLHNVLTITNYVYNNSGALISTVTSNALGVMLSESSYSGLQSQEKITSVTSFDSLHNIISTTNYSYNASGALTSTITTDVGGIILSESAYSGLEGQEKISVITSFDKLHNILTATNYSYDNSGALKSTVTTDSTGLILSESAYSGQSGEEKVLNVTTFDKIGNTLTTTSYSYDLAGALVHTITADASGRALYESVYSGLSGEEKVSSVTSFDKLNNVLTVANYFYSSSGALTRTVTSDANGLTLSESDYSGPSSQEKVTSVTTFDKLRNVLTTTSYSYEVSGALSLTVTTDALGVILQESTYFGQEGQEKISAVTSFDKLHNVLMVTSYAYDATGALNLTTTTDPTGVILSESTYSGSSGEEKIASVSAFDKLHDTLTITSYSYDASGALTKTITTDVTGVTLSESIYSGSVNGEKVSSVTSFNKLHNALSTTSYLYDNTGALISTVTADTGGIILSQTTYSGVSGEEKILSETTFDKSHNILTTTTYAYDNSAALKNTVTTDATGVILSESGYSGLSGQEKLSSVTSFDALHNTLTTTSYLYNIAGALASTVTADPAGVVISELTYSGLQGQEKMSGATSFDRLHNILTTTSYLYDNSGALVSTVTSDSSGTTLSESYYSGVSGQEKVSSVTSLDKLGSTLTITNYSYNASGALTDTITKDSSGLMLSESTYFGLSNQEKVMSVASFDKLGSVLTTTSYSYNKAEALTSTTTTDIQGITLSESVYSGLESQEKVSYVTTFDLLGNALTITNYSYNTSGALNSTVTSDQAGVILSTSFYSGQENQEKVSSVTSFDKIGNVLNTTSYTYASSGALTNTLTTDSNGIVLSESAYSGVSGEEKISNVTSFDNLHNVLTTTNYIYTASGALISTVTTDVAGVILSQSDYTGLPGEEKASSVTSFDKLHNILTVTSYNYDVSGTLNSTITKDAAGIILSESLYSGQSGEEKVSSITSFDKLHNILTVTSYTYTASGAIISTTTSDPLGVTLSESLYTGVQNQERVSSVISFDKLNNILTTTSYSYAASGVLTNTATSDANGVLLSEAIYSGQQGEEKVSSVISYDKLGGILTTTDYDYDASGALNATVTTDSNGVILSESVYSGQSGEEKVASVTAFDKAHNILTVTSYTYNTSGALSSTETADPTGVILSESVYSGLSGAEKLASATSFDKLHNILTVTSYSYDASGALIGTITTDSNAIVISQVSYSGQAGEEKISSVTSFDKLHNPVSIISYVYNAAGALNSTVTKDSLGLVLSQADYSGSQGQERITGTTNYDIDLFGNTYIVNSAAYNYDASGALTSTTTTGVNGSVISETSYKGLSGAEKIDTQTSYYNGAVESIAHYIYAASGALAETVAYKSDDVTKLSETYFTGVSGAEISDFTINYNDDGSVKNSVFYYYGSNRASQAFSQDALSMTKTYEGSNVSGDNSNLTLDSVSYYEGRKGDEIIQFSQNYWLNPDSGNRELQSTTIYEYDPKRTLQKAYTYFGGAEGSSDTSVLLQNSMATYTGERGHEQINYMEGTTCQYPQSDLTQWNYYVRTDFTYDGDGRNTGYTEKIYTPQGAGWAWESGNAGTLDTVTQAVFSNFDAKGRYTKTVRTTLAWNANDNQYESTGEVTTEENYTYDANNQLVSYIQIKVAPGDTTKNEGIVFGSYTNGRALTITTYDLDTSLVRTGDYSEQSAIVYGQYGQISSYTLTSSTNSTISTSNVFDIVYNKDKTIEDKMTSQDSTITFGPNYSVREYKYDSKGDVETTVVTNGDYVSIYDKDNNNIYFEYTPAMQNLKGESNTTSDPADGAGPRQGSQAPVSPFIDILQQAQADAVNQTINPNGQTQILYAANGEVSQVTDTKGNVFLYADNKPSQLLDSSGNQIALISYLKGADGGLTVSMTDVVDNSTAEFVYDKDNRRLNIQVVNSSGVTTRLETYSYTKSADNKVESAVVHKELLSDGVIKVTDSIETYDVKENVTGIYTSFKDPNGNYYISTWSGSYDSKNNLMTSSEVKCSSASDIFSGPSATDAQSYLALISNNNYSALPQSLRQSFATNNVFISIDSWSATYNANNTINTKHTEDSQYKCLLQNGTTYTSILISKTTTDITNEQFDSSKNVLKYHETQDVTTYALDSNGNATYAGDIYTTTDWVGTYTNNMVSGYTQTIHTTSSDGTLNLTETTTRSNMVYANGNLVTYEDVYVSSASPGKTTDNVYAGVTYTDGRITGYTEVTHSYGPGLDNTTTDIRHDMVYDAQGKLTSWIDDVTSPVTDDNGNNPTNVASQRTTLGVTYDDYGRMLTFTEITTGLTGVAAGQPMEWRKTTNQRLATTYNAKNQVTYESDSITTVDLSGNVITDKTSTSQTSSIQYDASGRQYSLTSTVNGSSSNVGTSSYNSLGQLTQQYTQIGNDSSTTTYSYDSVGNLLSTQNDYNHYWEQTSDDGKGGSTTTSGHTHTYTTWNQYQKQISQTSITTIDSIEVHEGFWGWFGDWIKPIVDVILNAFNAIAPGLGFVLSTIFDTVVSIANGTFSWVNLGIEIGMDLLQYSHAFDQIFNSIGTALQGLKLDGLANFFQGLTQVAPTGQEAFIDAIEQGMVQVVVTQGINEIGKAEGWDPFLTSAVSNFASLSVGYACFGKDQSFAGRFTGYSTAAIKSLAIASIDYYASKNPSVLSSVLAPLAKEALDTFFKKPGINEVLQKIANSISVNTLGSLQNRNTQDHISYIDQLGTNPGYSSPVLMAGYFENINNLDILAANYDMISSPSPWNSNSSSDVTKTSFAFGSGNLWQGSITSVSGNAETGWNFKGLSVSSLLSGYIGVEPNRENNSIYSDITSGMKAEMLSRIDNELPGVVAFLNDMEHPQTLEASMIKDISDAAAKALKTDLNIEDTSNFKFTTDKNGNKVLEGDVDYKNLQGSVKGWADKAGLKEGDQIRYELLSTGQRFISFTVKDAEAFFSQKNLDERSDIAKLKNMTDDVCSINDIKSLRVDVKISPDDSSQIMGATIVVNSIDSIKNQTVKEHVRDYMSEYFPGLKMNQGSPVLFLNLESGQSSMEAFAINTDGRNIRDVLRELFAGDQREQRLGQAIDGLVKVAGKNIESINLSVNPDTGDPIITVTMKSNLVLNSPLAAMLGIVKGSSEAERLARSNTITFKIDVMKNAYSLDIGLISEKYANIIPKVDSRYFVYDEENHVTYENMYDRSGTPVMTREYRYFDDGMAAVSEVMYARLPDGSMQEFKRVAMGTFNNGAFQADSYHFTDMAGLKGATFNYVINDAIVQFTIGQDLKITGLIPAANLGLKLNMPDGSFYGASSIPIQLTADSMIIFGKDMINVNGSNHIGVEFAQETKSGPNFILYNDASISIEGSSISIDSGKGFFFGSVNNGQNANGIGSPVQLNTTVNPVQNILAPSLAWADAAGGIKAVLSSVNLYDISSDGAITPLQGTFNIINDKIALTKDDINVTNNQLSDIKKDSLLEQVAPKYNMSAGTIRDFINNIYAFNGASDNSALAKLPLSTFANMLRLDMTGINASITTLTFNEAYNFAIQAVVDLTSRYPQLKDSLSIALIKDAASQVVNWANQLSLSPNATEGLSLTLENFMKAVSYLATAMNGINSSSDIIGFASKASGALLKASGWDSIGRFWSRDESIVRTGDEVVFTAMLPLGGLGAESVHIVRAYAVPILAGIFNDELTTTQKIMYVPIAFLIGKGTEKLWEGLLTAGANTAFGRMATTGFKAYATTATDTIGNYLTEAKTGIISAEKEFTNELGGFYTEMAGKAGQAIQGIGAIAKDASSKFSNFLMRTDFGGIAGEIFGPNGEAAYRAYDVGIREAIEGIQRFAGEVAQFIGERSSLGISSIIKNEGGLGAKIDTANQAAYGWRNFAIKAADAAGALAHKAADAAGALAHKAADAAGSFAVKAGEGLGTFVVSYAEERLHSMAQAFRNLPAKLVSDYINSYVKGAVVDFSEGKGPIAGATAGLSEAWGIAFGEGEVGLRQGWMAYGVGGVALAASSTGITFGQISATNTVNAIENTAAGKVAEGLKSKVDYFTNFYLPALIETIPQTTSEIASWVATDIKNGVQVFSDKATTLAKGSFVWIAYDILSGNVKSHDEISARETASLKVGKELVVGVVTAPWNVGWSFGSALDSFIQDPSNTQKSAHLFENSATLGIFALGLNKSVSKNTLSSGIPDARSDILIDEGGFQAGYHTAKHGVAEPGNVGGNLFGDRMRYVAENPKPGVMYATKDGMIFNDNLVKSGLFTEDAANLFNFLKKSESSTIWEGQYVKRGATTFDPMQVNMDFVSNSKIWRIAVDQATGRVLNFFQVQPGSGMKYTNLRVLQSGEATNPLVDNLYKK